MISEGELQGMEGTLILRYPNTYMYPHIILLKWERKSTNEAFTVRLPGVHAM